MQTLPERPQRGPLEVPLQVTQETHPFFPCAACPPGTWGPRCENSCPCLHSASCDPVSGECTCGPGWWGNRCHLKCDAFRCLIKKFRLNFLNNFVFLFCRFGNSKTSLEEKRKPVFRLFLLSTLFGSVMSNYTKCKAAVFEKMI